MNGYGEVWHDTEDGEVLMLIDEKTGRSIVLVPADTDFGEQYPRGALRFARFDADYWERVDDAE